MDFIFETVGALDGVTYSYLHFGKTVSTKLRKLYLRESDWRHMHRIGGYFSNSKPKISNFKSMVSYKVRVQCRSQWN